MYLEQYTAKREINILTWTNNVSIVSNVANIHETKWTDTYRDNI